MGELLEWLLRKENKNTCRGVGLFFVVFGLTYIFGGGFKEGFDGGMLSAGWFRDVFVFALSLLFFMGIILTLAGFRKEK
jgi:hypothetical protein